MLRLAPGTRFAGLDDRRARAGNLLGIQAGTFRRAHREDALLLLDLAAEIYRRCA